MASSAERRLVAFLNAAHLLDHYAMLIFPTAVVALAREWDRPYGALLSLATGGFVAFGACALPAGWLADRWSRYRMMAVFFFGLGASLTATGFAQTGWQLAAGLTAVGVFAAIYHPVGIAMLVAVPGRMGRRLGWNGLWGNLGLATAALATGALVDLAGWRVAFFVPGVLCLAAGMAFLGLVADPGPARKSTTGIGVEVDARTMARLFAILAVATACGGVVFNATTVSMPKLFDERLAALAGTHLGLGALVAAVYALAAFAQVAMGALIDRFEMRRLMIAVAAVQVPLLVAVAQLEGWAMLAAAFAMMLAIFGQIPLNDALVGRYVADQYRARVLALRYVVSLGAAALAVPLVAALHGTAGGFRYVFGTLALLAAAVLGASLFFPSRASLAARTPLSAAPSLAAPASDRG